MKKFTTINENIDNYKIQLQKGIKVESEHSNIYEELEQYLNKFNVKMPWNKTEFYQKIAEAHLNELSDYYDRLEKIEKSNS